MVSKKEIIEILDLKSCPENESHTKFWVLSYDYDKANWRTHTIRARIYCQDCNKIETIKPFDVHHLKPQRFWKDINKSNISSNLITLCHSYHMKRPEHLFIKWKGVKGK